MQKYILPILQELEVTASRNAKEAILTKHKDNVLLKMFFEAARNPFRTYNIKIIPDYKSNDQYDGSSLANAINSLYLFEDRIVSGNKASEKLQSILTALSGEDADVFCRIIKKDPECGIGATTINKIWPNLIPQNTYMGATAMSDASLESLDWFSGVYAQNKEDGMFINTVCNGTPKHFGRRGKEFDFKGAFNYLYDKFKNCRVDGEIRVFNEDFTGFLPRKLSNAYTNRFQVDKKKTNYDVNRLCFIVWDVIPFDAAITGKFNKPYKERLFVLYNAVKSIRESRLEDMAGLHKMPEIRLVHTEIVHSLEEAKMMYKRVKINGEEGLVLKEFGGIWQDGKPAWQVKLKNASECEMEIVGFVEHKKNKGTLGAFMLRSSDGKIETNCGSGLTDEQAKEFWEIKDSMLYGIVGIKFESIIWKEGSDILSFNLPIFDEYREDKANADDLAEVIRAYETDTGCKVEKEISDKL